MVSKEGAPVKEVNSLKVVKIPIEQLHLHPNNARQGDVGAIVQSLEAHGQFKPITVQKSTMNVLAGNHTLMAASALGWKTIEAVVIDVDDDQARRILLVDNRVSDLATYDDRVLAELLQSIAAEENFLDGTGFDGDDLEDLLFRLNGSTGFVGDALTPQERKEGWEQAGFRSIILPYGDDEYGDMLEMLTELRSQNGANSNSEVVALLVRNAYAGR
jgi:hypothetical protein